MRTRSGFSEPAPEGPAARDEIASATGPRTGLAEPRPRPAYGQVASDPPAGIRKGGAGPGSGCLMKVNWPGGTRWRSYLPGTPLPCRGSKGGSPHSRGYRAVGPGPAAATPGRLNGQRVRPARPRWALGACCRGSYWNTSPMATDSSTTSTVPGGTIGPGASADEVIVPVSCGIAGFSVSSTSKPGWP